MRHVLFTVLCIVIGVSAGLYLSRHLVDFVPENTQNITANTSIIMESS
jgi:hypothetical protein